MTSRGTEKDVDTDALATGRERQAQILHDHMHQVAFGEPAAPKRRLPCSLPRKSADDPPATDAFPSDLTPEMVLALRTQRTLKKVQRQTKRVLLKQIDSLMLQPEFQKVRRRKRPTAGARFPEPWQAWIADEVLRRWGLPQAVATARRRPTAKERRQRQNAHRHPPAKEGDE